MDREVIDPLLGLEFEAGQNHFPVQVLDASPQNHGIDGHGADGRRRVLDDGIPGGIQVAPGGQIHHRIGPPAQGPLEFLDLFAAPAGDRRSAHIGVDLGSAGPADRHGVEFHAQVNLVGGHHHAPGGDFFTDLLGAQVRFALGDALHFRRDAAEAGVLELSDGDKALGSHPLAIFASPILGHEIPRGLFGRRGHPRGIGRGEGEGSAHIGGVREASRVRAQPATGGIAAYRGQRRADFGHGCAPHGLWRANRPASRSDTLSRAPPRRPERSAHDPRIFHRRVACGRLC